MWHAFFSGHLSRQVLHHIPIIMLDVNSKCSTKNTSRNRRIAFGEFDDRVLKRLSTYVLQLPIEKKMDGWTPTNQFPPKKGSGFQKWREKVRIKLVVKRSSPKHSNIKTFLCLPSPNEPQRHVL